ncbi:MocR-like pyridoxine biosynthesis transcription factor PdxR [Paenibacillus xylaniclasticus]|uniref:MocR-like pyridoxine biosynthesis transcription factor PdxR n=1 Tax=Paenibacillus xylaniclasticus TaxID=588083 RepID=UPI000FDACF89|nr:MULTISPECIES: PLP-dependent aminotransferase family protein [Paenibacillus]GFN30774.1 putative HTH-type transcriptional regulator YhdI [Paenibacillus curdlanolyticus]
MIELTPTIDEHAVDPIYVQLYRYLRQEMTEGRIEAGARLPSVRKLAQRLAISRTPIVLAYEQLQAEGYIRSVPRSGLFTEVLPQAHIQPRSYCAASDVCREGITGSIGSIAAELYAGKAVRSGQSVIDFGYGAVDWSRFPAGAWRRQLNRCLQPDDGRMFRYGEPTGEPELREQIASYLHRNRGVRCDPSSIVIGAGTYQSLDLVLQLIGASGERMHIASEEAVNDGVQRLFDRHRAVVYPVKLSQDGLHVEQLADMAPVHAAYVTPSHQFPIGMTLSAPKRMKLLQWAVSNGAFIIENDYDGEFRYAGRPIPALQAMDEYGCVAYIGTFSRALTPSFRLSYAVLPPELLKRFHARGHSYDQLASPLLQQAMAMFMESGGFGKHMRAMRSLYQRKRDTLLNALCESFPIGKTVRIAGEGSGLHMLLTWEGKEEGVMINRAEQLGVRVYPVSCYWLQQLDAPRSTVLLGFGGLTEEQILEGVRLLRRAWTNLR